MNESRVPYLQSYGNTVPITRTPGPLRLWWRRCVARITQPAAHGGRNRVLCGGFAVTGRDAWAFLAAQVLLVVPCILFAVYVCPFLWVELNPVVTIMFIYLFLIGLVSMYYTSFSDPGIIPRNLDPFPNTSSAVPYEGDIHIGADDDPYALPPTAPVPREAVVNGLTVQLKYCETCKIYRPPRASHCRQCDNCIENEDHHCVWLNNCIGRRNYRSFFIFLWTTTIICVYITAFSIYHLVRKLGIRKETDPEAKLVNIIQAYPASLVLAIYAFIFLWSLGGLALYHSWLVSRNVTTHEQIRRSASNRGSPRPNPFDTGNIFKNCYTVLCRPRPPAYINWTATQMDQPTAHISNSPV